VFATLVEVNITNPDCSAYRIPKSAYPSMLREAANQINIRKVTAFRRAEVNEYIPAENNIGFLSREKSLKLDEMRIPAPRITYGLQN
jgi:hypothetical protein